MQLKPVATICEHLHLLYIYYSMLYIYYSIAPVTLMCSGNHALNVYRFKDCSGSHDSSV